MAKNIILEDINHKKPTNIYRLYDIWFDILKELSKDNNLKEIAQYNLLFVEERFIKEKIRIDNFSYLIIKEDNKSIGFIEYKIEEDNFLISKLYLFKKFKNKSFFKAILEELIKKSKKQKALRLCIAQNFKKEIKILNSLKCKVLDMQTNYIGSNFFLKEEIFEIKKIL